MWRAGCILCGRLRKGRRMNGRLKGAMLPAVLIESSKSSTGSSIGCRPIGCRHRIAHRSAGREVVADLVVVERMVSTVAPASPGTAGPVNLANPLGLLAVACGVKAVLLVRHEPTCRRRFVR